MPATAANTNTERKATSAAPAQTAQLTPSPSAGEGNKVRTHSSADTQTQQKQPSKYSEARKSLIAFHLLSESAPCTAQTLAGALTLMAATYKMPKNVAKALNHVMEALLHTERPRPSKKSTESLPELFKDLQSNLCAKMDSKLAVLEKKLTLPPTQEQLESAAKEIGQAAKSLKASINDIGTSIVQVTDTSMQLASTATSYKDALTKSSEQPCQRGQASSMQADPKILRDVDRKACQILIDTLDPKIQGASQAEIKEKVSDAIKAIMNLPLPKDTTILEFSKLHKVGFTILFKEIEVINWLQDTKVEQEFVIGISPDASITKCVYSILVPHIPLTFSPSNDASRLKHEPMQCMKCRHWGHFAYTCSTTIDTCGTCGGEHRSNECSSKEKTYCISCKSNMHASWDRDCPEFRRRCGQYDENYPENSLPYFPTSEDWTLTPHPDRLQHSEKFPAKYAVAALQQPEQAAREPAPKPQGKQCRQQQKKIPANQATMDHYIAPGNVQGAELGRNTGTNNADTAAVAESDFPHPHTNTYPFPEDSDPQSWD
jgi:hypothetical protein